MELIYILLFFSVDFLSMILATGRPDPPTDIRIHVNGSTANISWTIPTNQEVQWSQISLKDSKGNDVYLTGGNKVEYVKPSISSLEIANIKMCSDYTVKIKCISRSHSNFTSQTFWMTNELQPPRNVTIQVIKNTAKVLWTITTNQELNTSKSLISLFTSNGTKVAIDSSNNFKYLKYPVTSYDIVNLTLCSEYVVKIEYLSRGVLSDITEQKFWMTDKTVIADTNEDVALTWTTGLKDLFDVVTPSSLITIYNVVGGIIPNTISTKYKYNTSSTDVQKINITIVKVNKTDAGLYTTNDEHGQADGCCLLVVTDKPKKPTLTLSADHQFVGDNITFTCHSMVQRWPAGYRTSKLIYIFWGNTRGVSNNNRLIIHTLTMNEKGKDISCQATDDFQKVSIKSDAVTLDPYYGPDNVVVKPGHKALNITEGTTLGPIHCTATCNPKCLFKWRLNKTGHFEDIISSDTLIVPNITKNQSGIYRCAVVHRTDKTRRRREDISVNIQYSPKIKGLWLNGTYVSAYPTFSYSFSEVNNLTLSLRIDSNPDPPHIVIHSSLLKFPSLLYTKQNDDFSIKLPSLKCENSGNYTIQASNGIAYGANRTVNLEINCKPRNVTTVRKIGAKINTDVNIVMNVVSFPAPTVTWIRMTQFVWTVRKDKYDYRYNISSTIQITSEKGFGEHGLRICNREGCIMETITVKPEDRPEAPQNVSSETPSFRSVNLSWIAGFNGGHRQNFSVQFKTVDNDNWDTRNVYTSDTRTGSKVYYTLDQLKPDTAYQVMVLSTNKHGERNASLEFKTEVEPTLSQPSSASVSPLSIGIGSGIAVLVLTIILLVFIIRRKKTSQTESKECSVLYAEVDKEQHKGKRKQVKEDSDETANAEYASVVKSKSKKVHYKEDAIETENNEYAVVDKSNKDYTENESVYANQDDEQLLPHKPLEAQSSGRNTNQDGLTYIEVSFTSNQSDRRPIIGAESKTDYVDIDFTRKADPLPDDSD